MRDPPPVELRFVKTVASMEAATAAMRPGRPLLLVVKATWCERCPAFAARVAELALDYEFDYYYTDAADTELTEHHSIAKLPAFVLHTGPKVEAAVHSPASPDDVSKEIRAHCAPRLQLDAEF